MKILLTGSLGQVGAAINDKLDKVNCYKVIPLSRKECDLTKSNEIKKSIDSSKPDLIINAAAYTNVKEAEKNKKLAFNTNVISSKILAEKAAEKKIPIIHFSTDYVFDGKKMKKYNENDKTNPLNTYGLSKLQGEQAIRRVGGQFYIFRTSWVYSNKNKNFYLTIKNHCKKKNKIKVVDDQYGVPTSNNFIAHQIKKIIPQLNLKNVGTYNLVPNGEASWYNFATEIVSKTNPNFNLNKIYAIKSDELNSSVIRPKFSILDNKKVKKIFNLSFNTWEEDLDLIIREKK
jgi:dTDP-4-dehydrorhamnose reductase